MTRCGQDTKIMFCGDAQQSDLQKTNEKTGILDFQKIIANMEEDFSMIEYGIEDIVRSGLVKNYIIAKLHLGF
jgi:phosphate starvation-inducible protein PhoH